MILKILVVIWFLKMLIKPFSKEFVLRTILKSCGEDLKRMNFNKDTELKDLSVKDKSSVVAHSVSIIGVFLWKSIMYVIDFIMMLSILKYDNTYITLAFIILSILDLLTGLIKSKMSIKKNKNESSNIGEQLLDSVKEIEKTTFKKIFFGILNVLYWGYAVYLLFF